MLINSWNCDFKNFLFGLYRIRYTCSKHHSTAKAAITKSRWSIKLKGTTSLSQFTTPLSLGDLWDSPSRSFHFFCARIFKMRFLYFVSLQELLSWNHDFHDPRGTQLVENNATKLTDHLLIKIEFPETICQYCAFVE